MEKEAVMDRTIGRLISMEPYDPSWRPGCGRRKPFGNFGPWWIKRLYGVRLLVLGEEAVVRRRDGLSSGCRRHGERRMPSVHAECLGQPCRREAPFGMFPNDSPA